MACRLTGTLTLALALSQIPNANSNPTLTRYGGDRFQPLFFQTLSQSGKATDMYKSTFGLLPELTDVLGDAAAAQRMLVGSLG